MSNFEPSTPESEGVNLFNPIKLMRSVSEAPLRPCEKVVLLALLQYLGNPKKRKNDWWHVWPSQKSIKEKSGVKSESQISRITKKLQYLQYLKIKKKPSKNGFRRPNCYIMNIELLYKLADTRNANKANGQLPNKQPPLAHSEIEVTKYKGKEYKSKSLEIPIEEKYNGTSCSLHYQTSTSLDEKESQGINIIKQKESSASNTLEKHHQAVLNFNSKLLENNQERALYLVKKYWKAEPSAKVKVAFWWALIREFRPAQYKFTRKLTKFQYRYLLDLFEVWGDHAFYIISVIVSEWESAKYNCSMDGAWKNDIPKLGPTPTVLNKYQNGLTKYWNDNKFIHQPGKNTDEKADVLLSIYKSKNND